MPYFLWRWLNWLTSLFLCGSPHIPGWWSSRQNPHKVCQHPLESQWSSNNSKGISIWNQLPARVYERAVPSRAWTLRRAKLDSPCTCDSCKSLLVPLNKSWMVLTKIWPASKIFGTMRQCPYSNSSRQELIVQPCKCNVTNFNNPYPWDNYIPKTSQNHEASPDIPSLTFQKWVAWTIPNRWFMAYPLVI